MSQAITPIYRRVRATIWLPLGFMYASYYMTRYNLSFAKTTMTQQFGWSNEQWGWISASFFWMYAFGQFVNGLLTDKLGGRKAIVIGAIGTVTLNLLFAGGADLGVLGYFIAMWAANGYFQAFGAPSIVSVNGQWFALRERGTFSGIFGMMIQLGRFAITLLGGYLIAHHDWPALFTVPALITAAFAILAWFTIRDTPEELGFEGPDHGEDSTAGLEPAGMLWTLKKVIRSRALWIIAAAYFCTGWVRHGFEQWFPAYLQEVVKLSPNSLAFQLRALALPVAATLGAFAAGILSDKLFHSRRGPPTAIMYFAQFVLLLMFFFVPGGEVSLAVYLILISFFVNGPHSLLGGAAAMDFGGRRAAGSAAGMVDAAQYVGAGVVQPIVGIVIDNYGWGGWTLSLAGFALIGGILMTTMWNTTAKPRSA